MKTVKSIVRSLVGKAIMALAGLALLVSSAQAASVTEMWVLAKGNLWARLVPNSNTGGRVIYNNSRGYYYTDRAARGERVEVYYAPTTGAEQRDPVVRDCVLTSNAGQMRLPYYPGCLPCYTWFNVPTNPAWDNNAVHLRTASGDFPQPIPVGSR